MNTISRKEFDAMRVHDYAGFNPDGTVWLLYYDSSYGTCLAKRLCLLDSPTRDGYSPDES